MIVDPVSDLKLGLRLKPMPLVIQCELPFPPDPCPGLASAPSVLCGLWARSPVPGVGLEGSAKLVEVLEVCFSVVTVLDCGRRRSPVVS